MTQSDKYVTQDQTMTPPAVDGVNTPAKQPFVAPKLTFVAPKLTKRGDFADRNVHQHTDAAVH